MNKPYRTNRPSEATKIRKIYAGCYRFSSTLSFAYGHIRRDHKGKWIASIHNATTGDTLRPAGLWDTLNEARLEVEHLMFRDYRAEG